MAGVVRKSCVKRTPYTMVIPREKAGDPWISGVSGILDRPVKPDDDSGVATT